MIAQANDQQATLHPDGFMWNLACVKYMYFGHSSSCGSEV